jgi:site-specific DNA-methyltransferase (cytosine-N4-specific)
MSIRILPPYWPLQPFEKELAFIEVERLIRGAPVGRDGDVLTVEQDPAPEGLRRIVRRISFARAVENSIGERATLEYVTERAAGGGRRKVTSHALHGLHPYKGKFYPQLARALLNACDVPDGGLVVDPFAGCGTSVLEASLLGIRGVGVDANPMAVLVSQAKLRLLGCPADLVEKDLQPLRELPERGDRLPNEEYLADWFPEHNLNYLRRALAGISRVDSPVARDGALVALSSVLREASWQDPKQLRVGRRRADAVIPALVELFPAALNSMLADLRTTQAIPGLEWRRVGGLRSRVVEGDSRRLEVVLKRHVRRRADAVITSPPYASALPYVDTDRLSLHAFGLMPDGSQRRAEGRLIGNREITDRTRIALEGEMAEAISAPWMPPALVDVLLATTEVAREPTSGFRKRRTPALLWAYFRDMRLVLEQLNRVVRPGGPVAVVIADNMVAGPRGTEIRVPTVDILVALGQGVGLSLQEDLSKRLTSYGACDTVHQRNAMETERILLFRQEGVQG